MTRRIVVVSAALSESSATTLLGERLAEAAQKQANEPIEIRTIELRNYFQDIAQAFTAFPPERLREVFEAVASADGVIAVTPIYNTSYSGLYKSFFDVLPEDALRGTPTLIGATGGTPRHSLALDYAVRPMMAYLKAEVLTTTVFAATEDWGARADEVRPLPERIELAGAKFADAVSAQPAKVRQDEFESTPSFEEMMSQFRGGK
ncbi:MAG TPA: CE1759 family FMN reductase [Actinomycetaceae bacterium]|nr:CE1759 family FMN reductase [Actinomycetaceae bacterium]